MSVVAGTLEAVDAVVGRRPEAERHDRGQAVELGLGVEVADHQGRGGDIAAVRLDELQTGVSPYTVYGWRRRLDRMGEAKTLGDFFEVAVTDRGEVKRDSKVADLVIGEVTVHVAAGFDGAELARLLDVVRPRC